MTFEEFLMIKVAEAAEEKLAKLHGFPKQKKEKKHKQPKYDYSKLVTVGGASAGSFLAGSILEDLKEHSVAPIKSRLYSLARRILKVR